jgi:hypothetical protein
MFRHFKILNERGAQATAKTKDAFFQFIQPRLASWMPFFNALSPKRTTNENKDKTEVTL